MEGKRGGRREEEKRNRKRGQAMKRREEEKRKIKRREEEERKRVKVGITKDTAIGEAFHTTRSWRDENEASGNLTWYAAGHARPLLTSAW